MSTIMLEDGRKLKKVCIVGAGNVGVALGVDIATRTDLQVVFQTSKSEQLNETFTKFDPEINETLTAEIPSFNSYEKSVKDSDVVICTVPSFVSKSVINEISRFSPPLIIFVPGYGGKEFCCKSLLQLGSLVIGLSRSPYVARLKDLNYVVASKKKTIDVSVLNSTIDISKLIEELIGISCKQVKSYLTITFTPSNPILHTARIYSMLKNCNLETPFSKVIKFYSEWDDDASETLLQMDYELINVCKKINEICFFEHIPLSEYYEADTVKKMTQKILSIQSWKDLNSPMKKIDEYFYIDSDSRYFREDFPFGLCILRGFAEIADVRTPVIDKVLRWYEKFFNVSYFDNNEQFCGDDLHKTGIPQNFGITKMDDVKHFYNSVFQTMIFDTK